MARPVFRLSFRSWDGKKASNRRREALESAPAVVLRTLRDGLPAGITARYIVFDRTADIFIELQSTSRHNVRQIFNKACPTQSALFPGLISSRLQQFG